MGLHITHLKTVGPTCSPFSLGNRSVAHAASKKIKRDRKILMAMDCKTYIKFCVVGYIFYCLHQTLISNIFVCYSCNLAVAAMYEQADGTYTHNIEKLVHKVCALAHEKGDEHERHCLRASSLQCLSAMVVL